MICKTALALMLGLSLATAEEAAPAAATADFAPGFQRLVALGLSPLDGAEWIAAGEGARESDDYELREIFSSLKGGGWKLQFQGKPVFLPLGALDTREMPASSGGGGGLLGGLFGGGSKGPKSVDPVKDAAKLIATLDDPDKSKDLRERLEYRGGAPLGRLLIFAAQLHQSGHPAEANRLAASVFALGANPESVIDAVINRVAARDLSRVTEAFFTSRDWAAYERDLRALVERYPRGWGNFPAVQMLLPAVAKRVAGGMPPKPVLDGIPLRPEAIAALDDALQDAKGAPDEEAITRYAKENGVPAKQLTPEVRQQISRMLARGDGESSGGPWLIEEPPDAESKDPWSRVKRLGLDALPALAAVAKDEKLTFSRNASSDRSYSSSNRESAAELALAAYKSMDRPLSRGELACRLLASTLPGEDHDESSPQALADAAIEFWKAQRGKPKLDLLLVFLAEGDSSQKSTASTALAEMPDEAAHQAFEKHVLEGEELTSSLDSVATYLKLRKAAAKDFFIHFSAALKNQLDGVDLDQISGGYEIKRAGGVDKYLKRLSLFVGGESPRKMVLELAKAEKPDLQQIASVAEAIMGSAKDEFVPIFLEAANSAPKEATRIALLSMIYRHTLSNRRAASEAPKNSSVPPQQIPQWTTLLADERSIPYQGQVRFITANLFEQLCSPGSYQQLSELSDLDQIAYENLILTRSKDRLAGKAPPPLPDPAKFPAARLDELLKLLFAAKPEAVHDLVQAWTLDEKAAYSIWRSEPENRKKIPANVVAASRLLTAPLDLSDGPPVAKSMKILQSLDLKPGAKIDANLIISLAAKLAGDAKASSGVYVGFSSSPLDTGLITYTLLVFDGPAKERDPRSTYVLSGAHSALGNSEDDAVVIVSWASEDGNSSENQAIWKLKDAAVTAPEAEVLQKFREAMESLDQPDAAPLTFEIQVMHRDDVQKFEDSSSGGPQHDDESESPEE